MITFYQRYINLVPCSATIAIRFQYIKEITFSSTFCALLPREARIIVLHWEGLKDLKCRLLLENASEETIAAAVAIHLEQTLSQLAALLSRLEICLLKETSLSSVSKAFVKLSTRSPKDSKKILDKAKTAYKGGAARKLTLTYISE